jgi:hypothetical protein
MEVFGPNQGGGVTVHADLLGLGADDHPQYTTAAELAAFAQPLDADLTAIAALTTTAYGRGLLDDADASAAQTTLGISTFFKTLLDDADASAVLTTLGISTFIKTLLDDADAVTARATLGVIASLFQSGGAQAIKLDDLAAPDDNTDLNASTSAHGLLKKLPNVATQYLDGTGAFSTPASGGGLFSGYALLRDVKAAGTDGGTFTSGAFRTRDLNTESFDVGGIVSISSNQFTLQAGTYYIVARLPAVAVDHHGSKLRNITDGSDTLTGSTGLSSSSGNDINDSMIRGRFTIAGAKAFELQHVCQTTKATVGFGSGFNMGVSEVYTEVEIWKEV